MSPRWEWIEELLDEALKLPVEDRHAFLLEATAGDSEALAELSSLLDADQASGSFLGGVELPSSRQFATGARLGAYKLLRELGRGGTGIVYLAERADDQFEKLVAIKVLRGGSPLLALRFRIERQILASLEHPQIARLYDSGVTPEGAAYYVMEHVDGEPIDLYCDRHRLSIAQRIELFRRVCAAVEHAHRHLVVHRDIKPANLLMTAEGSPKLLDFGIAKLLTPSAAAASGTGEWVRVLTPHFASPEQILGRPITTSSDIYSLGVLLHLLVTGALPQRFESQSLEEIERALAERVLKRPSLHLAQARSEQLAARGLKSGADARRVLSGDLDTILLKVLASEPEQRYSSAAALADDLERHLAGRAIEARGPDLGYRFSKWVRRHRFAAALGGAAAAAILATTAMLAVRSVELSAERNLARRERDRAAVLALFFKNTLAGVGTRETRGREVSVREALDQARVRAEAELAGDPLGQSDVRLALGTVYSQLGLQAQANQLLTAALESRRRLLGPRHLDTARTLTALGRAAVGKGDIASAEKRFRESLELLAALLPEGALDASETASALARLLRGQQRLEEAEPWSRLALGRAEEAQGDEAPLVAQRLNELAGLLLAGAGREGEVEKLLRRALLIQRRHPDIDSRHLASQLSNLAEALVAKARLVEAEGLILEVENLVVARDGALALGRPVLLNQLADFAAYQGHHDRAIRYRRQALEVARAQVPRGHPHERDLLLRLGRDLLAAGQPEEAKAALADAVRIDRAVLPPGHLERAESEALLAAAENATD